MKKEILIRLDGNEPINLRCEYSGFSTILEQLGLLELAKEQLLQVQNNKTLLHQNRNSSSVKNNAN